MRVQKYKAKKTVVNGETFDSKKEAGRFIELTLLEKSGVIRNLKRQVPYELIPNQYVQNGKKKKLIERKCVYRADFVYETDDGTVVEDTKGFKTSEYIIKRKLMLEKFGIRIKEI